MQLIDNWKALWSKLWSVRLALLAALFSAVEVGFSVYLTGKAPVLVLAACAISFGAAVARIVAQPTLHSADT